LTNYKTSTSIVHPHFYQNVVACDQIFLSNQLLDLHLSQELFLLLQNGLHQHLSLLFLEQECHLSKKKKTQNNSLIAFTLQIHLIIYGSWIYNYLCNQCISSLKLWVRQMLSSVWPILQQNYKYEQSSNHRPLVWNNIA
jgi:hypothetical protein